MDVWRYSSIWIRIQLMKKPFFSIIIPTLNEEKYLPHLLADLAKQTFQDFEVIVIDGQSTDQTVPKTKLFKSCRRGGSRRHHISTKFDFDAS